MWLYCVVSIWRGVASGTGDRGPRTEINRTDL
jgi:hypothetical protein